MTKEAVVDLLMRMADDQMIIGHRNSEWTGLGPILEEDIAFSSMAQDKIGHAFALYQIAEVEFGQPDPDTIAFVRPENEWKCSHLTEYPIGEYDFSLVRHFLFDYAEFYRFELLEKSSLVSVSRLAQKVRGEIKYHIMHAETWMKQLSKGTEESKARMQSALNEVYPIALSMFEPGVNEEALISEGVFAGEEAVKALWHQKIQSVIDSSGLTLPSVKDEKIAYGGRKGFHTEHLKGLLSEMTEVYNLDPQAKW